MHAEHEFKRLRAAVVPAETAFRLEKHRVDGLRLEFAVQHQQVRIVRGKFGADLFAVNEACASAGPLTSGGAQTGMSPVAKLRGTDPAGLHRRIDIRRLGGRAGNPDETMRAVRRDRDRAGLLAVLHEDGSRNARRA